jgi:hypothetical protein
MTTAKQPTATPQTTKTAAPNDNIIVVFDPSTFPEINTVRIGVIELTQGALSGDGKTTQAIPKQHYLLLGVNEISPRLWEIWKASPHEHIQQAIAMDVIRVLEPWDELKARERREVVRLCTSGPELVPTMQRWLQSPDNPEDLIKAIQLRITELGGSIDAFSAARSLMAEAK